MEKKARITIKFYDDEWHDTFEKPLSSRELREKLGDLISDLETAVEKALKKVEGKYLIREIEVEWEEEDD